jgi:hypothetical protein
MKTFTIEVQEFLSRIVEVEANSSEEAIHKVFKMYREEEIVLDYSDYVTTEIDFFPKTMFEHLNYLANGDNFYMIEDKQVVFWGKDIEAKRINLTPEALAIINEDNIPSNEPCEFAEESGFKLFSLLYY